MFGRIRSRNLKLCLAISSALVFLYFAGHKFDAETIYFLESDLKNTTTCRIPSLPLWPLGWTFDFENLDCTYNQLNWVYVREGRLLYRDSIYEQHGGFKCMQAKVWSEYFQELANNSKLLYDTTDVVCKASNGKMQQATVLGVVGVKGRVDEDWVDGTDKNSKLREGGLNLDIIMIGFDSVSRLMWERALGKSIEKFKGMGGVLMEGYNILGDGTPQALLPILTGMTEVELPEARRGFPNATTVDAHPWIWKELKRRGYITQWGEDSPKAGTFRLRMLGFKKQPVDHHMEPFHLRLDPGDCYDQKPTDQLFFNYLRELLYTYDSDQRKFSFLFHSRFSHDNTNFLKNVEDDVINLLDELDSSGVLDQSLLILMSDHGARFSNFRASEHGKYEERLPFMGIRLPQRGLFKLNFPDIQTHLEANAHKLTSPFDLHETFLDVLYYKTKNSLPHTRPYPRGLSLLRPIPGDRMCADIGIEPHWCTCMHHTALPTDHAIVANLASFTLTHINTMLSPHQPPCALLTLSKVTSAVAMATNKNLLAFKKSADSHGRMPDLSDQMTSSMPYVMISIVTSPNNAFYEVTLSIQPTAVQEISRINAYGNQPNCIKDTLPHLRPYCLCSLG